MDLTKLAGQQLLKISQSSETGQHIIEFAPTTEIEQVIEIDPENLGECTLIHCCVSYFILWLSEASEIGTD